MTFISRVQVDTANRKLMKQLSHLGAYHNWIETSIPENIKHHVRPRNLWRIDNGHTGTWLMLVSNTKPDLQLLERFGVHGTAQTKNYDNFISKLSENNEYHFQLTASPTYDMGDKRYPHVTIEQQLKWLAKRAENNGFELIDFDVINREYDKLYHSKHSVKLSKVTFSGTLHITDIEKFSSMLVNGIGRERAYGCGLMTVMPVQS